MSRPINRYLIAVLLLYLPAEGGHAQAHGIPRRPPQLERWPESAVHRVAR
jgi:hypothetical protein